MLSAKTGRRRLMSAAVLMTVLCTAGALSACRKKGDASFIGTFRMGERVQLGPLVYQVLESDWRAELGPGGRSPKDRYLFVRLSVTNSSGNTIAVPALTIEGGGKTYSEVTENTDKVDNWLGLLRNVAASQSEQGWIVFDAPMAAYKLVLTEGEVGQEKTAHVDIPVQLE
jgi:hypothetical protein